jgi:hypothetical protein
VAALPSCQHKYSLHGSAVEIACEVPGLNIAIDKALGDFTTPEWPDGFTPTLGCVRPYDQTVVLRHLSPSAASIASESGMELYCEGERFWLIDDRWGLAEINLLKGQWQSWILPQPMIDAHEIVERAVLWPLSQVLRSKGIYLLPAASVARSGWGMLILSPFGLEPELEALMRASYRVVGQRWTCLREEDGQIAMLHVPAPLQITNQPRAIGAPMTSRWQDVTSEKYGAMQHHAFCDAVVIVEPGRRPTSRFRPLPRANAVSALKKAWPIEELHPQRRLGILNSKLPQLCQCAEIQLSRRALDVLTLADHLRKLPRRPQPGKLEVTLDARRPRQIPA